MLPAPDKTGYFVNLPSGQRLHLVASGEMERPLVVLLHGYPQYWYAWRHQLQFLDKQDFRAVAVDLRGVNFSDKPKEGYDPQTIAQDIADLIHELGYAKATVIGHDFGGVVAYALAACHPEVVERIAVINSLHPARWPTVENSGLLVMKFLTMMADIFDILGVELAKSINQMLGIGQIIRLMARKKSAFPFAVRDAYSKAHKRSAGANIRYIRAFTFWLKNTPLEDTLISQAVLVLWAQNDWTSPQHMLRGIEQSVPNAQVIIVPDAGHFPHEEQPEFVNEAILKFITNPSG